MPDISMCSNIDCPLRLKCYRFTAKPNTYQTYADFQYDFKKEKCLDFWDNSEYDGLNRK